MRKLMWFTIGFALFCGLWVYLLPESAILSVIILLCCAVLAAFAVKRAPRLFFSVIGFVCGMIWCGGYHALYLMPAVHVDGKELTSTVLITDYSYETDYGVAADGRLELDGKTYYIRVYLNEKKQWVPGDTVAGTFHMRYTPGGEESTTYHPGKGIFLLGYQRGEVTAGRYPEQRFYPSELAQTIKDTLRCVFSEDLFPFTQALLLGDTRELDYETETAFRLSGIRHIIAVSGLHVTILYSLLNVLVLKNRYMTALLGLPVLAIFAAVAGFTPSVTRACIMVGLMILAQVFQKEYDSPSALAFAVLWMLVVNPMVISSVSFQLSVGCVIGIQLFQAPISEWMKRKMGNTKGKGLRVRIKRHFISSVSMTLSAMSVTTPLTAFHFGSVSLVGVVTNLATLWAVHWIFNGLAALCLLYPVSQGLAYLLSRGLSLLITYVLRISSWLASVPMAAVYTQSPYIVIWLVFVYILLAVFLRSDRKKPGVLGFCAVLSLLAALLASWMEPLRDDLRITMLDVGQGQSILLQSQGKTFLVDCGGDDDQAAADVVSETLLSQGIVHLDGVIVTHCDRDHAGGLPYLLTRIKTDAVFYPATENLVMDGTALYPVNEDLELTLGNGKLTIYGPIFTEEPNENSLCVLFTLEDCDILITGDRSSLGEFALLTEHTLPDVELLVAGHHGSKYSTSEALLQAVCPDVIFISAGADNPYGHPSQEMLDRADAFGAEVYRTDTQGTLIFRR